MVKTVSCLQLGRSALRTLARRLMNIIITSVSVLAWHKEAQASPSELIAMIRLAFDPINLPPSVLSLPLRFQRRDL